MFVIIGWVIALACLFGAFLLHGGKLNAIVTALPFEMLAIGGATVGAFLANNRLKVIKSTLQGIKDCFRSSKYGKSRYIELISLLHEILQKAKRDGMMSIESDVENPEESPIFKKYPIINADHHIIEFITDYLRMMVSGNLNAHEIENLIDHEIDTHHSEAHEAVEALQRVAGGLPAFGIVAAVLGVINTMGSVGRPPSELGAMIGSALVGTFLGILLSYAIVEPLAGLLSQKVEEATKELHCIKITLLAAMQGYSPILSIEFGRKVLYSTDRPSFNEMEEYVKRRKSESVPSK